MAKMQFKHKPAASLSGGVEDTMKDTEPEKQYMTLYNGHTHEEIVSAIEAENDLYKSVNRGMGMLFSPEEIISGSVTGQKANSITQAKPRYDPKRYQVLVNAIKKKYGVSDSDITKRVHSTKKKLQKKN